MMQSQVSILLRWQPETSAESPAEMRVALKPMCRSDDVERLTRSGAAYKVLQTEVEASLQDQGAQS